MRPRLPTELVLALMPTIRGIAYTYFEGPLSPVDWGIKEFRTGDRNVETFIAVRKLIEAVQPDVLVLIRDPLLENKKTMRRRRLTHLFATYASTQGIEVKRYTRDEIRRAFAPLGAQTRVEIAHVIAGHVHAFSDKLPKERKIWKTEDVRMALFDAAALAFTYFNERGLLIIGERALNADPSSQSS